MKLMNLFRCFFKYYTVALKKKACMIYPLNLQISPTVPLRLAVARLNSRK